MQIFTVDELTRQCIRRGYVARYDRHKVTAWCEDHPKDFYTEEDLVELYRYLESPKKGDYMQNSKWNYTWDGHKSTKRYDDDECM
jgi:hypothetical protein